MKDIGSPDLTGVAVQQASASYCWLRGWILVVGLFGAPHAGRLGVLAWALVTAKVIVLSAGGLLVAAVVSVVGAAGIGAEAAFRLHAAARLLKQGRITDATIVSLDERLVSVPSGIGFSGWVTKVKVSFTDASGHLINAGYTEYGRAGEKREDQTVQISYDPSWPVSIAPVGGGDFRFIEAFLLALGSPLLAGMAVYQALRAFG